MKVSAKRLLDLALAVPALIASLPIQAAAATAIVFSMGRPILFRQQRPGLNGQPFELVKFRTMLERNDVAGLVEDGDRLTPLGALLRSTSLDELPTLWNVVRGDMSLVGPRPLLMSYIDRYSNYQARRHEVLPGLTGLAQINGRNAISWERKFDLDVTYVDNHSLCGDMRIILATVRHVLGRRDITAANSSTMPEFMGTTA